ncbi:MAG: hypothetical protein ACOYEV_03455 [Candidatus Nanopelagicales bacterium]
MVNKPYNLGGSRPRKVEQDPQVRRVLQQLEGFGGTLPPNVVVTFAAFSATKAKAQRDEVPLACLQALASINAEGLDRALSAHGRPAWRRMAESDVDFVAEEKGLNVAEVLEGAERKSAGGATMVTLGYELVATSVGLEFTILRLVYEAEMRVRESPVANRGIPYPSEPSTYYLSPGPSAYKRAWESLYSKKVQMGEGSRFRTALKREFGGTANFEFDPSRRVATGAGARNDALLKLVNGRWLPSEKDLGSAIRSRDQSYFGSKLRTKAFTMAAEFRPSDPRPTDENVENVTHRAESSRGALRPGSTTPRTRGRRHP